MSRHDAGRGWYRRNILILRSCLLALVIAACSSSKSAVTTGRIVVVMTIDWEGADLSAEGLDALAKLRATLGAVPITHFVSAAYITKEEGSESAARATIAQAIHTGDELAVHLHVWTSLARASGIEPRSTPSFLTGTDQVVAFEDGDVGFDTDLDTYEVPELRALLRTSRTLLEKTRIPVSKSFRAGGYLTTPKVLRAILDEGFAVDSSAIDFRHLGKEFDQFPRRVGDVWPKLEPTTQPFLIGPPGARLIEMPIAAVADFVSTEQIVDVFDSAHARLQTHPDADQFVVLGFHLETADDFANRIGAAITTIRGRKELASEVVYVTMDHAAELASFMLVPIAGT